jgi:hypothetical protein
MDFYSIGVKETRNGVEIYPEFLVQRSKDLMIRGQSFYAIWDADRGLWSTDEYDVRVRRRGSASRGRQARRHRERQVSAQQQQTLRGTGAHFFGT